MRPASQRFFIQIYIYLRILIISYLATSLGTSSLSVLMCRKAVNQSNVNRINIKQNASYIFTVCICLILVGDNVNVIRCSVADMMAAVIALSVMLAATVVVLVLFLIVQLRRRASTSPNYVDHMVDID